MTQSLHEALEHTVAHYLHGGQLVLLFDYDSALADTSTHASPAHLPRGTRNALEALAAQPRVAVGIFSGRDLDELKRLIGLNNLFYAGTSGLEMEVGGHTLTHPLAPHSAPLVNEVANAVERLLPDFPAARLERKRFGLSLTHRDVERELVPILLDRLDRLLACWPGRLHVVAGASGVEITPNLGWTKGTAVEAFLENVSPGRRVLICAGDEAGDAEALWIVGIQHGITIGVGHALPTIAQFELPDAEGVERLLESLCQSLGIEPAAVQHVPPRDAPKASGTWR